MAPVIVASIVINAKDGAILGQVIYQLLWLKRSVQPERLRYSWCDVIGLEIYCHLHFTKRLGLSCARNKPI